MRCRLRTHPLPAPVRVRSDPARDAPVVSFRALPGVARAHPSPRSGHRRDHGRHHHRGPPAPSDRPAGIVNDRGPLLALVGTTASGKTEASIGIAKLLDAEILCVDSMLVYRGMDVGTAKPSPEQRAAIPHHLLDLVDPSEPFSVAQFQSLARNVVREVRARGGHPLLVGGGGLYY